MSQVRSACYGLGKPRHWVRLALLAVSLSLAGCGEGGSSAPPAASAVDKSAAEALGFAVTPGPTPLPRVEFTDGEGTPRTLADFRGKVVLLNLWATWCPPCREEMPTLDALQAELGGADFEVVALSIDQGGVEVVRSFFAEIGVEHLPIYNDESAQAGVTLEAFGVPVTLLLDRNGHEVARLTGAKDWHSPEMVEFLRDTIETTGGRAQNAGDD